MAANMKIRKMKRDLAEQKDYMKNLRAMLKNISEKFNLVEGKLDQHLAAMEKKLEEQVRKKCEGENKSTVSSKKLDYTNGCVEQYEKSVENNEASQLQTMNQEPLFERVEELGEENIKSAGCQNSDDARDSATNEITEIIKILGDMITSGKRFFDEKAPLVLKQEPQLSSNYFCTGEMKEIVSESIKNTLGDNESADEEIISTYETQVEQIKEENKSLMNQMKEIQDKMIRTKWLVEKLKLWQA